MKTSGDTLLRMIQRFADKEPLSQVDNEPKVIGVDDWAWGKGCTYGIIIVDLERRKVIDLLPDREAATLTDWLLTRPGVETVARDRLVSHRNGIMMGRSYATQVADRWHLLSNLDDVLEKIIERLLRRRKTAARQITGPNVHNQAVSRQKTDFEALDDWQWERSLKESFEQMKRNACRLRLLPHLPVRSKIPAVSRRKPAMVSKSANRTQSPLKLDAKTLRSLCFRQEKLSEDELEMLFNARAEWDEFEQVFPFAEEFVKIVRGQGSMSIRLWIVKAFNSAVKELKSFANGLQKDFLAVKEAIVSEWSNGQTEGQVNRLKLLKRQMYGRAKFDLLKARVLNPM
jgi:transposase